MSQIKSIMPSDTASVDYSEVSLVLLGVRVQDVKSGADARRVLAMCTDRDLCVVLHSSEGKL